MVFHATVVEHVGANLRAPFDFFLASLDFRLCFEPFFHGAVVELRLQQEQGLFLVLRLVARFGVFDEDFLLFARVGVGVPIAQPDARLHLVHVLAAGAARAERVPRELGRIDIHLDGVIDERRDEHRRKRGHSLALRVERRHAHEPVHAVFRLQEAVGKLAALDFHRHALDAGLVALLQVRDGDLVAVGLGPAHIHSHQHLGPVLALGAACARVDFQHAVHRVFLLAQHVLEFEVFDELQGALVVGVHLFFGHHVVVVEVEGQLQLVGGHPHGLVVLDPLLDAFHLLHLFLGAFHVVPEVGCLRAQLLFLELHLLLRNVQVVVQLFGTFENIFELFLRNHGYSYILSMTSL